MKVVTYGHLLKAVFVNTLFLQTRNLPLKGTPRLKAVTLLLTVDLCAMLVGIVDR